MSDKEVLEQLEEKAKNYAATVNDHVNTGYLLLAIFTGGGVAANILKAKGLSEPRIRSHLRGGARNPYVETDTTMATVIKKAQEVCDTVKSRHVSAVHLLAGMTTVTDSFGYRILHEEGQDVSAIRVQALRNMCTGLTREHGQSSEQNAIRNPTGVLCNHKTEPPVSLVGRQRPSTTSRDGEQTVSTSSVGRLPSRSRMRAVSPVRGLRDMGHRLEQAQKKTRDLRTLRHTGRQEDASFSDKYSTQEKPASFELTEDAFPSLCALGRNLSQEAREGRVKPIVGRVQEIEQIADILVKKRANCPCLVGPSGVGKTAVVEGLAFDLAAGSIEGVAIQHVVEIGLGDLLGGTTLRGELGERIAHISEELQAAQGQVVLFFDDVHMLLGSSEAREALVEIQAAMGRGAFPCIWSTTEDRFDAHVNASAFSRLVSRVDIGEPSEDESIEILMGVAPDYEVHHGVSITDAAIKNAVALSNRYVPEKCLPDKAISIIDLAAARARRRMCATVEVGDVATVLAKQIGVPTDRLTASEAQRLLELEGVLSSDIVGHGHVLNAIGETLRRNAAGFRSDRPIGSFLFLGPTGVGKTETAKALARHLFADEKAMIRMDMSEFSQPHAVARLIGAPPGYVGHEEGGQLTEAVRKRPYSLVLLDEIEKAHRDVMLMLLQVLDDGRLTDGSGNTISFTNTVLIMTSNLGADLRKIGHSRTRKVGFGEPADDRFVQSDLRNTILEGARAVLAPELWNRIDEPLVFAPLEKDEVTRIAQLMLDSMGRQLKKERGVVLLFEDGVAQWLVQQGGYDMQLGARPMRRTISRLVEGPLARLILAGKDGGDAIDVSLDNDVLHFAWHPSPTGEDVTSS